MKRVFLDANVLYSAAHTPESILAGLWRLREVRLLTSSYVVTEVKRNLRDLDALKCLDALLRSVAVLPAHPPPELAAAAGGVADKDLPVLQAAVALRCDYLLTGDLAHFGHLFGKTVAGVTVLRPARFMELFA